MITLLVSDYVIFLQLLGFLSSCRFILYFDDCSFPGVDRLLLVKTYLTEIILRYLSDILALRKLIFLLCQKMVTFPYALCVGNFWETDTFLTVS